MRWLSAVFRRDEGRLASGIGCMAVIGMGRSSPGRTNVNQVLAQDSSSNEISVMAVQIYMGYILLIKGGKLYRRYTARLLKGEVGQKASFVAKALTALGEPLELNTHSQLIIYIPWGSSRQMLCRMTTYSFGAALAPFQYFPTLSRPFEAQIQARNVQVPICRSHISPSWGKQFDFYPIPSTCYSLAISEVEL